MSFNTVLASRRASQLTSWKAPVRVALLSAGLVMSGPQTLQAVALVSGDRVLVIDGAYLGLWLVQDGAWARSEDGRLSTYMPSGTAAWVNEGTYAGSFFVLNAIGDEWDNIVVGGGGGSTIVDWKDSVRAASTANINLSAPGAAIDGVTMAATERFLAKNQTAGADNGIYVWNGAAVAATRAADANSSTEVTSSMAVSVSEGATNLDTSWILTTNDPITLGTTALVFAAFGAGGGTYPAATLTTTGTIATAGTVRIANNTTVQARNAANSGNIQALAVTAGDVVALGAAANATTIDGSTLVATANTKATIASTTEVEVNAGVLDLNSTGVATVDATTSWTETAPAITTAAATEYQIDTALLDQNATTWTADGTTATVVYPTCTVTANTKLTLASTTECEVNAGIVDVNATGVVTIDGAGITITSTGVAATVASNSGVTLSATGGEVAISAVDGVTLTGAGGGNVNWTEACVPSLSQYTRTTDAAPNDLTIQTQSAYASAVTNKSGGYAKFRASQGSTPGTDSAGGWKFDFGRLRNPGDGFNTAPGVLFYRDVAGAFDTLFGKIYPKGTELRLESSSGAYLGLASSNSVALDSAAAGSIYIAPTNATTCEVANTSCATVLRGSTMALAAATSGTWYSPSVSIGASASTNRQVHTASGANHSVVTRDVAGNTAKTGLYDDAASSEVYVGPYALSSSSGSSSFTAYAQLTIQAQLDALRLFGLDVRLYPTNKALDYYDVGTGLRPIRQVYPTQVTPGGAGATSVASMSVDANTSGRFEGVLTARNGSTNSKTWNVVFNWNADGTTITIRDFAATAAGTTQGTIGSTVAAGAVSGLTFPIEVTSGTSIRHSVRGTYYADA